MRALLVGAEVEENLAIRYLWAALERAGHQVQNAAFDREADGPAVRQAARDFAPDLIGLSIPFQRRAHQFGELAAALRQDGQRGHITCGGHFPTFAFAELLERYPAIDSVVRHEGEQTLVELCHALEAGAELDEVRGVVFRDRSGALRKNPPRPLCPELDALPFPVRPGQAPRHLEIPTAFLVGSRGCHGHCTFCCINGWINEAGGPRYRARSVDNLADEMAWLYHERGVRLYIFHDDDFLTRDAARDLGRVTALREALQRRDLRDIALVIKVRPDDVDPRVLGVLREMGLLRVYLGIETASTQGLRTLGRGVDMEQNRRALRLVLEQGIYACFNLLLFDPDSTVSSLRENLAFLRQAAAVPMNFCRTEVYVGTPLMRRLQREGRLDGDAFGWDYEIADPRAEAAFRLFARAFMDRNFRADGLMNSNLGLGYHLHLLRRFHPHAVTPALTRRAEQTITRVNLDCVRFMERIVDFAASPAGLDERAARDFGDALAEQVARADQELEREVEQATLAIVGAATRPRARRPRWQAAAAAAALALPLAACPPRHPPPDPPPPPHARPDLGPPPDPPPPPHVKPDLGPPPMPPDPPPPPHRAVNPGDPPPRPHVMPPDPVSPPDRRKPVERNKKDKKDKKDKPPPPPPPDPLPPPHRRK